MKLEASHAKKGCLFKFFTYKWHVCYIVTHDRFECLSELSPLILDAFSDELGADRYRTTAAKPSGLNTYNDKLTHLKIRDHLIGYLKASKMRLNYVVLKVPGRSLSEHFFSLSSFQHLYASSPVFKQKTEKSLGMPIGESSTLSSASIRELATSYRLYTEWHRATEVRASSSVFRYFRSFVSTGP